MSSKQYRSKSKTKSKKNRSLGKITQKPTGGKMTRLKHFFHKIKTPLITIGTVLLLTWLGKTISMKLIKSIVENNTMNRVKEILSHPPPISEEERRFLSNNCTEFDLILAINYVTSGRMRDFSQSTRFYDINTWKTALETKELIEIDNRTPRKTEEEIKKFIERLEEVKSFNKFNKLKYKNGLLSFCNSSSTYQRIHAESGVSKKKSNPLS